MGCQGTWRETLGFLEKKLCIERGESHQELLLGPASSNCGWVSFSCLFLPLFCGRLLLPGPPLALLVTFASLGRGTYTGPSPLRFSNNLFFLSSEGPSVSYSGPSSGGGTRTTSSSFGVSCALAIEVDDGEGEMRVYVAVTLPLPDTESTLWTCGGCGGCAG